MDSYKLSIIKLALEMSFIDSAEKNNQYNFHKSKLMHFWKMCIISICLKINCFLSRFMYFRILEYPSFVFSSPTLIHLPDQMKNELLYAFGHYLVKFQLSSDLVDNLNSLLSQTASVNKKR